MHMWRNIALFGNIIFILWIVRNGIDEGFRGVGSVQAVSLSGLIFLLILNFVLLWKSKKDIQ